MNQYVAAAVEYINRKRGLSRPDGRCDNGGRWYPSDAEDAGVSRRVRSPSRAWPWSYYKACFALPHIAELFGCDDMTALRLCVRRVENLI
jgi:hypothetical protein